MRHVGKQGRLWRTFAILVLILIVAVAWFGLRWHREHKACLQQDAAFEARVEAVRHESKLQIPVGTPSKHIIAFLESRGFSAFLNRQRTPNSVVGTKQDAACPQIFGCGNEALVQVEVTVDQSGKSTSEPEVDAMYSDCL